MPRAVHIDLLLDPEQSLGAAACARLTPVMQGPPCARSKRRLRRINAAGWRAAHPFAQALSSNRLEARQHAVPGDA
jgi:hypothetical protein